MLITDTHLTVNGVHIFEIIFFFPVDCLYSLLKYIIYLFILYFKQVCILYIIFKSLFILRERGRERERALKVSTSGWLFLKASRPPQMRTSFLPSGCGCTTENPGAGEAPPDPGGDLEAPLPPAGTQPPQEAYGGKLLPARSLRVIGGLRKRVIGIIWATTVIWASEGKHHVSPRGSDPLKRA